uniref:Uncharacterized protein n=1 Tax=Arundo donax TaxID=35708 RepID=A0A0A8XRJ8_ARUDO
MHSIHHTTRPIGLKLHIDRTCKTI